MVYYKSIVHGQNDKSSSGVFNSISLAGSDDSARGGDLGDYRAKIIAL